MKSFRHCLLPVLATGLVTSAWAQKEVTIRRLDVDGPRHGVAIRHGEDGPEVEKEKVAFLGVETAPVNRTLAAQLGLPRDTGLVVTRIADKSPAADVLREDDVLTKLDDQILVNQQQLGVLVRARKEGDEVKLTVVRGGKESTVKAKLGVHEVPRMAGGFPGLPGPFGFSVGGLAQLRDLPGMDDDHARDVLRLIGREHQNMLTGPGVRILRRGGQGSTILDLPNSNISYSDEEGTIEIKADDGRRTLTLKDSKGKVTFQGPISTEEERKSLPAEVVKRLRRLDDDTISFEAGEKFRREILPLPAEPGKSKISHELGRDVGRVLRAF